MSYEAHQSVPSLFMVTTALEIFLFRLDSMRGCPYWPYMDAEVLNFATELRDDC
jgi:hypothetical protein